MSLVPKSGAAGASPRGVLNGRDVVSVLRMAAIAGAAFGLTRFVELWPSVDLGPYGDVITLVVMVLVKAIQRWLSGQPQAPKNPVD